MDRIGRQNLLLAAKSSPQSDEPNITEKCALLDIPRSSIYNKPKEATAEEIRIKHRIDELHNTDPTWGSRTMSSQLKKEGFAIGRKKTRRFMTEMAIDPIYPKPNLSKGNSEHKIYPYLLRNVNIQRPNQVWAIDITYIRLGRSFCYLTAIIDWYSRMIVGWQLDDSLSARAVKKALNKAFASFGTPEIINSDQGSQFTGKEYTQLVRSKEIKISMDGKGRWADNVIIERWFRTLKYSEVYLKDYKNINDAKAQIGSYICHYNAFRPHSSLQYKTPAEVFFGENKATSPAAANM